MHPGLVQVEIGAVESTEVVDRGHHVFQWVIGLQKQALVALNRIGGGMSFGKGISGKALDLSPDLGAQLLGVSFLFAIVEELFLNLEKFLSRSELPRHSPPQHVSFAQRQPAEVVGHFDHVFLVDHHPVGLGHDLQQDRVGVSAPFRMAVPQDVFPHHARF